jgi:8-oxo-dGTP diphosphatase
MAAMMDRARVAAVIIRDGAVLMVRERLRGAGGRHDGLEYWTVPGGGIERGEDAEAAVVREVAEEVRLRGTVAEHLFDYPYPSGLTAAYLVTIADGDEPAAGGDPGLACDCPRITGVDWVPLPKLAGETGPTVVPTMLVAAPGVEHGSDGHR